MIVKCISKYRKDLPPDCLTPKRDYHGVYKEILRVDQFYVVYAMSVYEKYVWYYVSDQTYRSYPFWNPSPFFQVVDPQLSKYWIYSFKISEEDPQTRNIFAFPEWANDPDFYNGLYTENKEEIAIFNAYKEKMDLEFPNPAILAVATILDTEWLYCPLCQDAWQSISEDGMVICGNCKKILHNPRYVSKAPKNLIL